MSERRTIRLGDVFTEDESRRALALYKRLGRPPEHHEPLVDVLVREITAPALPRINEVTGQENDARYWAYMLIHVFQTK